MMENITVSCGQIQTAVGFVYNVSSVILNQTQNPDCEQFWYPQEDGVSIADPSANSWIDPATNVTSDRIVTNHCVQKLLHEIICDSSGFRHRTTYRAWNETAEARDTDPKTTVTPSSDPKTTVTPSSDQLFWIFALLIPIILLIVCYLLREKIVRWFQRGVRDDSENRDAEAAENDRCDAPHTADESEHLNGCVTRDKSPSV